MKEKFSKKEKGITLIALVITIIVLLILAGVSISMLSGENGILNRAAEAKEKTEMAQVEEEEALNSYEEMINGYVDGSAGSGSSGDSGAKWAYKEDENGRKTIITNGKVELKIGDYVSYDPTFSDKEKTEAVSKEYTSPTGTYVEDEYATITTNPTQGSGYSEEQAFSNTATTNGWRVLGVDEETGELQIISADPIQTTESADYYLQGYTGAMYGEEELNKICEIFGYGYGASRTTIARSVNVDDVNKITGYNPSNEGVYDPEQTGSGTKFNSGFLNEYGNKVKYTWNISDSGKVDYSGNNNLSGTLSNSHRLYGFNWLDETSNVGYTSSYSSGTEIITLTSNFYHYNPNTLVNSSLETEVGISTASKEYLTLFCNKAGSKVSYWFASPYANTSTYDISFGLRLVDSDSNVDANYLFRSIGDYKIGSYGVRPVVSLKSGITLSGNSTDGWTLE